MVGEYLVLQRSDTIYKVCNTVATMEELRICQGFVQGLDTYLELEDALDQFKLASEADLKRMEEMSNRFVSSTSQAEAMGII